MTAGIYISPSHEPPRPTDWRSLPSAFVIHARNTVPTVHAQRRTVCSCAGSRCPAETRASSVLPPARHRRSAPQNNNARRQLAIVAVAGVLVVVMVVLARPHSAYEARGHIRTAMPLVDRFLRIWVYPTFSF